MMPRHAVVLLAAGGSRRLGEPKQLLDVAAEPLARRAARTALATDPSQALVVLGAHADAVWSAVADLPLARVDCDDWAAGLSASIRAGLRTLDPTVDGALFVLCDQPGLTASHLHALVSRWRSDPERATASAYSGTIGVPAIIPRSWFHDLESMEGDRGARGLLRDRAAEVATVDAPSLSDDLDLPADVEHLRARSTRTPNQ